MLISMIILLELRARGTFLRLIVLDFHCLKCFWVYQTHTKEVRKDQVWNQNTMAIYIQKYKVNVDWILRQPRHLPPSKKICGKMSWQKACLIRTGWKQVQEQGKKASIRGTSITQFNRPSSYLLLRGHTSESREQHWKL